MCAFRGVFTALDVLLLGIEGDSRMRRLWLSLCSECSGVREGVSGSEGDLGRLFSVLAGPGNQSCCKSLPHIPVFSSSLVQSRTGCQHKQPLKEFSKMIQYFPL